MASDNEQPMAWGMTYQQCRQACMATALAEGDAQAAALYRDQPLPSEQEWALYLQEVAEEASEDLGNPHHVMGRYELRLHQRGLPTTLARHAVQVTRQIQAVALEAGVPLEFVSDALGLANEGAPLGLPRNKTRDN